MPNEALSQAKAAKNDEFYTQWSDIEREVMAYIEYNSGVFMGKTVLCPCDDPEWSNFTKFFALHFAEWGMRALISTSYAAESKKYQADWQPTPFKTASSEYNADKTRVRGKIFTLEGGDKVVECLPPATDKCIETAARLDIDNLKWHYMAGDGDFRSDEVAALMRQTDAVVTNPPFSLFREFLKWIVDSGKEFLIIGNMNAITYKEVFPLIRKNKMWLGPSISSGDREFGIPSGYPITAAGWRIDDKGNKFIRVKGVRWFTNIDHGRRHKPLRLMTMADNIKYSKHNEVRGRGYAHYDNYDAIEVPFTDSIPADYKGVMGVPISFLDKYCPEQFEILDLSPHFFTMAEQGLPKPKQLTLHRAGLKDPYARVLIRARG